MADILFKQSAYMQNAVLKGITSLGVSPNSAVSNLARSGQLGTGIRFTKLDGATPAVFNPVVGVVLSVPSMWDRWPKLQEMLRAVMETHAKSITGIDFGYTLETGDTIVGHDGQTMKVPTRTTRGGVNPSASFQEYPGMPIYNLFRTWMFDIQHPDTNMSLLPATVDTRESIPAWYMSAYSMSMIFIQYDPSGLPDRIYDAAIITNMFPTEIGEIGFERTIGTTQLKERSVSFAGIVQHNENTRELGYQVANMLALHKINYNFALPGLAGVTNVDNAIQMHIRDYGGLEFEAHGGAVGSKNGEIEQYHYLGTGSDNEYSDQVFSGTYGKNIVAERRQVPQSDYGDASASSNYGDANITTGINRNSAVNPNASTASPTSAASAGSKASSSNNATSEAVNSYAANGGD